MEYGELIHDFVDGTLDSNLESGLFVELASNQQLRSELKQFIEFERTARYDTAAYAPTAETTAGVFSKLGIPLPLATTAVVAPSATGILATLGKYSQGIIGGIVAALMTAGVMYFSMNDSHQSTVDSQQSLVNSRQSSDVSRQTQDYNSNKTAFASDDIPVVKSEENVAPKVIERVVVKYVDRPVYIEQSSIMDNGKLINAHEEDTKKINIETANLVKLENVPEANLISEERNDLSLNPFNVQEVPYDPSLGLFDYLGKLGFEFEVTGADYWMFPKDTMPKSSNPFLENTKFALAMKLSDKLLAGIELRQEYFYHEYKDDNWLYKQSNNYWTPSVFIRWMPLNYDFASLMGQISFGGNKGGTIGRIMLGPIIKPSSDYSFVIGLEYSGMTYYHNNNTKFASKLGLHYGMMFNF